MLEDFIFLDWWRRIKFTIRLNHIESKILIIRVRGFVIMKERMLEGMFV